MIIHFSFNVLVVVPNIEQDAIKRTLRSLDRVFVSCMYEHCREFGKQNKN